MSAPVDLHAQAAIAHWGWTIAWFLWFVGIAGMGSVAYVFVRRAALAYVIFGSLAVGIGLVTGHLSRWWNLPRVMFNMVVHGTTNWGSWMLIGTVLLTVHLFLALVLVLAHLECARRFRWLDWARTLQTGKVFLGVFAAVGFMVTVYSGFLISDAAGIPLWNTALIPVLWVISSSVAAIAVLELCHLFGGLEERVSHFSLRLGIGLDALKLLAVLAFLHVSLSVGSTGARLGAIEMVSGRYALMTWLGVICVGILIPLAFGLRTVWSGPRKPLLFVSAVSALTGALLLRAVVLLAGVFEPLA